MTLFSFVSIVWNSIFVLLRGISEALGMFVLTTRWNSSRLMVPESSWSRLSNCYFSSLSSCGFS